MTIHSFKTTAEPGKSSAASDASHARPACQKRVAPGGAVHPAPDAAEALPTGAVECSPTGVEIPRGVGAMNASNSAPAQEASGPEGMRPATGEVSRSAMGADGGAPPLDGGAVALNGEGGAASPERGPAVRQAADAGEQMTLSPEAANEVAADAAQIDSNRQAAPMHRNDELPEKEGPAGASALGAALHEADEAAKEARGPQCHEAVMNAQTSSSESSAAVYAAAVSACPPLVSACPPPLAGFAPSGTSVPATHFPWPLPTSSLTDQGTPEPNRTSSTHLTALLQKEALRREREALRRGFLDQEMKEAEAEAPVPRGPRGSRVISGRTPVPMTERPAQARARPKSVPNAQTARQRTSSNAGQHKDANATYSPHGKAFSYDHHLLMLMEKQERLKREAQAEKCNQDNVERYGETRCRLYVEHLRLAGAQLHDVAQVKPFDSTLRQRNIVGNNYDALSAESVTPREGNTWRSPAYPITAARLARSKFGVEGPTALISSSTNSINAADASDGFLQKSQKGSASKAAREESYELLPSAASEVLRSASDVFNLPAASSVSPGDANPLDLLNVRFASVLQTSTKLLDAETSLGSAHSAPDLSFFTASSSTPPAATSPSQAFPWWEDLPPSTAGAPATPGDAYASPAVLSDVVRIDAKEDTDGVGLRPR
eukprot:gene10269-12148_t